MRTSPTPEGDLRLLGEIETDFSPAPAVDKGQLHAGADVNAICGSRDDIQIWNDPRAKHLEEYQNHLPLPKGTCEVLVPCAGRLVTPDLFNRETFAVLWDRLSWGCFFDALGWPVGSSSPDAELVERSLDRLASFARSKTAIGLGDELEINSTNGIGAALVYDSRLCHLAAFADAP